MTSRARRLAAVLTVVAALLVVGASLLALAFDPVELASPLVFHALHVAAAFAAGVTILRLPRAAPADALELVVLATALGLGVLALATLALAAAGLVHPLLPGAVDVAAVLLGLPRLRPALDKLRLAWQRLDVSVVMASRIPLAAALVALSLPYLVPPMSPATEATGAAQLAVPSQAAIRGDLKAALRALPGTWPSPSQALLLHGALSGGHVGARLHGLTFVVLLALAAFLHAGRHLGPRARPWVALCLVSMPALLRLGAADFSACFVVLMSFLAWKEISDWCAHASGGKIPLACLLGGLAAAESPAGVAVVGSLLVFLFVVQALVDGHGVLRQVPGLLGMGAAITATAVPFLLLAAWLHPAPFEEALAARFLPLGPFGADLATAAEGSPEATVLSWLQAALLLGPLVLGLLLFVPMVAVPPEGLRHATLAAALGVGCILLPAPYATAVGVLGPAATTAGASAVALLASRGFVARAGAAFVAAAVPVTLLVSLALGPDVFGAASVLVGRTSRDAWLGRALPDHELMSALAGHARQASTHSVLLVGALTDCHVPIRAQRRVTVPADAAGWQRMLADGPEPVTLLAIDRQAVAPDAPLDAWPLLARSGPAGRYELRQVARPR